MAQVRTDELCGKMFLPEEAFVPWLSVFCVSCCIKFFVSKPNIVNHCIILVRSRIIWGIKLVCFSHTLSVCLFIRLKYLCTDKLPTWTCVWYDVYHWCQWVLVDTTRRYWAYCWGKANWATFALSMSCFVRRFSHRVAVHTSIAASCVHWSWGDHRSGNSTVQYLYWAAAISWSCSSPACAWIFKPMAMSFGLDLAAFAWAKFLWSFHIFCCVSLSGITHHNPV